MKPKRTKRPHIDRDYLRRGKRSTPEQKLMWLAAARELVIATRTKEPRGHEHPSV